MRDHPVTARLNFVIFVAAVAAALYCLTLASTASSVVGLIIYAVAFSFVGNTLFSLTHEAVHGYLFPNRSVNERAGVILAGFFPTSFTFQRAMHLGHHRRNRTDVEMFDLYYPEDNRFLKWAQLYGIFTGPYWAFVPISAVFVSLFPWIRSPKVEKLLHWRWLERTGVFAMLSGLSRVEIVRIQFEVFLTIALQGTLFYFLDLTFIGWATCYFFFAVNWGALQYADHAFSVRDIKNGAWNLKVSAPVQWIFLNYHSHLAHHQNPQIPWYHLPQFVEKDGYRPTFWKIFFAMLRGPKLVDRDSPLVLDVMLENELKKQAAISPALANNRVQA